jgi:hypothetical protein
MNILEPIFLSHVVLRFSPSDLPGVTALMYKPGLLPKSEETHVRDPYMLANNRYLFERIDN